MKAIKGIVIAIIVIIVIAIIGFLTLNKKSLDTTAVVSKATNSPVAQGVANTPADSNNIVSPNEKTTTAKEDNTIDKPKTNESTNSTKTLNDSNNTKDNKTITSATEHKQNNNTTKNSNIANNTNTNNINNNTNTNNSTNTNNATSNKSNDAIPSKNNNIPVNTNKTINNNNVNNSNNKATNTSETQNLQSYYLNQLTGITEQINAMPTKNDDDAQLLQNAGTQCNLWNAELNKIMNKLSAILPSSEASTLQNEEFQWIQNRNNEVQNTSNSGGSIAPILGAQKEAQLTKERCYYLVNNYM